MATKKTWKRDAFNVNMAVLMQEDGSYVVKYRTDCPPFAEDVVKAMATFFGVAEEKPARKARARSGR
jgi:hypothetical protein